ncbi:hypothetical protein R1sor_009608 [Riccia sorocarpa]|uniref:Endonuclease/exonuclease/phosphatase domain-containing protein n=1 Tax=Riccia sorocarpa TaxID=122646 RepID=A0ABD3HZ62_9MARC
MTTPAEDQQAPSRLRMISWNVGGLGDQHRKIKVKELIKKEKPLILALQETKLCNNRMKLMALNVAPAYQLLAAQGRNGGGTALLLHSSIQIQESGFLPDGHLVLPYKKWTFLGDWNVVELPEQSSGTRNLLEGAEEVAFRAMKLRFCITDTRYLAEEKLGPKYTRYCFYRNGEEFRWSTIDRIYVPTDWEDLQMVETSDHKANYTLSDHFPVCVDLQLGGLLRKRQSVRTYFKFDWVLMAK